MRSTDDIIHKEFSHSFIGYDMREVDFFLDELIDRFEKLEAERKEMLAAMEYLLQKVEALGGGTGDGRTLAAAESTFQRLNAAAASGVAAGPVRVQAGAAQKKEPRPVKKRPRPAPEPEPEPIYEPEPEPEEPPVAIEVETEGSAPDMETLMPELLDDMEAVMEAGIRRAAGKAETPEEDPGDSRA